MAAEYFLLHYERIEQSVYEFNKLHPELGVKYYWKKADKQLTVEINAVKGEKPGLLQLYFKDGKTSKDIQGNRKCIDSCHTCWTYIYEQSYIRNVIRTDKTVSIKDINEDELSVAVDFLSSYKKTEEKAEGNIIRSISIFGPFDSKVRLNHYNTKTLTVQGTITTLFIYVLSSLHDLFKDKVDFLSSVQDIVDLQPHKSINPDLTVHLTNLGQLQNTPYESMIKTSIALANSQVEIGDYSPFCHSILRALEGIIGLRIFQEVSVNTSKDKPMIGEVFCTNASNSSTPHVLHSKYSGCKFYTNQNLKTALEQAYEFYRVQRHSLFHSDVLNPEQTRVLVNIEDAVTIIEDALKHIKSVLNYW